MTTLIERIGTGAARSRIGRAMLGEVNRQTQAAVDVMLAGYVAGPWQLPPDELVRQVRELDPWQIQSALDLSGWDVLSGYTSDLADERERAVLESRRLYRSSPLAQWAIWLWTGWGLGDSVEVSITGDDNANEVVQEFWKAPRNQALFGADTVSELSNWLLADGNTFLVFYSSEQDGETSISELDQDEVVEIITHPQNRLKPLFYKRQFQDGMRQVTWYYPDYQVFFDGSLDEPYPGDKDSRTLAQVVLPAGAIRADTGRPIDTEENAEQLGNVEAVGTGVCVYHLGHNRKERGSLWGWPILTVSWPWLNAHKKFAESRLTIAQSKAMYVRRKRITGGNRALNSVRATIASNLSSSNLYDTNPPAVAGSTELDNAMIETTDLPMTTGASDAKTDNELFSWMPLLGAGLFPTSAGLDTARWATALEMDKAQSMIFERYRAYWATAFRQIARIALMMKGKYTGITFADDLTIEVSVDAFSLADFPGVAKAIGTFTKDTLAPYVEMGLLPAPTAQKLLASLWRISLQALGVSSAGALTSDEAFGVMPEEEVAPEEETVIAQIAAVIHQNAKDGLVDWQSVGEWALEELRNDPIS